MKHSRGKKGKKNQEKNKGEKKKEGNAKHVAFLGKKKEKGKK